MASSDNTYWFRPKRFGFGSEPASWQGWLVVTLYIAGMLSSCLVMLPTQSPGRFILTMVGMTVIVQVIVAVKKEPKE